MDAKVKKGEWTREEDEKLLQLCQEYQDNGDYYIEPYDIYIYIYYAHIRRVI